MWENIGMSTYCANQTFHTATNSYFFINVQFCLEIRRNSFTLVIIIKVPARLVYTVARSRKKTKDTEYRCLDGFVSDIIERRISSYHLT